MNQALSQTIGIGDCYAQVTREPESTFRDRHWEPRSEVARGSAKADKGTRRAEWVVWAWPMGGCMEVAVSLSSYQRPFCRCFDDADGACAWAETVAGQFIGNGGEPA